jgi:hypothetical protein
MELLNFAESFPDVSAWGGTLQKLSGVPKSAGRRTELTRAALRGNGWRGSFLNKAYGRFHRSSVVENFSNY